MIIDGKKIAEEMNIETSKLLNGVKLRLAAVVVGPDTESGKISRKFLELKKRVAEKMGIEFRIYEFPENISEEKLRQEIIQIDQSDLIDGVIIELPLPTYLNTQSILDAVSEEKDVDVLSEKSQTKFYSGDVKILPPAVEAIKAIFEKHSIDLKDKVCAVFGYGILVGRPISHWLKTQGANVSVIDEFTENPKSISQSADIIVSGVGSPNLIIADMVKEGAIVIDFGPDVDFESVQHKASLTTPPTGGVGPIVIAAVLKNIALFCARGGT